MQIKKRFNLNKNKIYFITLCFLISTIIRFSIFPEIGLLQNDDYLYHIISNNIINGNGITSDGINPHLHFPPGYPFILGLESFIVKDPMLRRCLEWSIFTGLVSLFTYVICNLIEIKRKYLTVLICFFTPAYIYGTYTLIISSETWFSLIGALGLIFSIKYINNKNISDLFFANIFFSITYLIRPEGILFYASSLSIIIVELFIIIREGNLKNKIISEKGLKIFLSFLVPFLIFVCPYLIYLNSHLGMWTLSGKGEAHAIITTNINNTFIERFIGTIDLLFLSPFFLGLSITFLTLLTVLKYCLNKKLNLPNFYGKNFKYFLVLFTPLIPNIYISLKYFPGPRSIYGFFPCIIPLILMIFESADFNEIYHKKVSLSTKSNFFKANYILNISILFILTLNLIVPKFLLETKSSWINNPKFYNKTIDLFESNLINNNKPLVYSRNFNLAVDNNQFDICYEVPKGSILFNEHKKLNCLNRKVDFLILSNISHQSLSPALDWELNAIDKEKFYYRNQLCSRISKLYTNDKNIKVIGFKCNR